MNRADVNLSDPAMASEGPEMIASMRRGVVQSLREHKENGRSVIVWDAVAREIVEVPPDEIDLSENCRTASND